MSTQIRTKTSTRNKWHISNHRYLELKHFCLQYHDWLKAYQAMSVFLPTSPVINEIQKSDISDSTSAVAIIREEYGSKIRMVQMAAKEADPELEEYILRAVTGGVSYTSLSTIYGIPACRDTYYDRYRKFFYILDKMRD